MNRPAPFPMQPLDASAPDALRRAWYTAEHAWKLWQVKYAVLQSVRANSASFTAEWYARDDEVTARDKSAALMNALLTEYHTALSTMDGATQRTA